MNALRRTAIAALAAATLALPGSAAAAELTSAIPPEAHLFVHARHNPERDYQVEYVKEVWNTFQEEQIGERLLEIVTSRMPDKDLQQAKAVWNELCDALGDANFAAITEADEFLMYQMFTGPVNQTTFAVRLSESDAASIEQGLVNLMELASDKTNGKLPIAASQLGAATLTSFDLPDEVPLRPTVARAGDVLIVSTSESMVRSTLSMLSDPSPDTKYADPRVTEALDNLPEPEDAFVFFDGAMLFERLRGIPDFIRSQKPNDEGAERFADVFGDALDELAVFDYEATVEYTDGLQNRTAVFGRLADGYEQRMLGKAFSNQELFDDWQAWIPADATSYSLSIGVDLHEIYAGIMTYVAEEFPEAEEGLQKFAELQEQIGVHLDKDILQSISGESVSVSFPLDNGQAASVTALKCDNPDKLTELLQRAVDNLKQLPPLQAQQLDLVECDDLDGFLELKMAAFAMAQARPVIGVEDGWMIFASTPAGAEKFLAVRRGEADNIGSAGSFEQFDLQVDGPVAAASYTDIGAGVRQAADLIDQAAAMAPMFLGMAASEASPEEIKPLQELVGLLPSIAKVVRKCDFLEERLSITRGGPLPNTYLRESVTLVRAPAEAVAP